MKYPILITSFALLGLACATPGHGHRAGPQSVVRIDTMAIREHTYFLSDDALRGRGTGTSGSQVAAHYIRSACVGLGLRPIGDSYLHRVPLEQVRIRPDETHITLTDNYVRYYRYPMDFTVDLGSKATTVGFSGPAVYVGDEASILDLEGGKMLRGAVAVTRGSLLPGDAVDRIKEYGVTGMVHLATNMERYVMLLRSRGSTRMVVKDSTVALSLAPSLPAVVASPGLSRALLSRIALLGGEPITPQRLQDRVQVSISSEREAIDAHNVICVAPGDGTSDSAIAYTAHYDHLGISYPDARGDSLYNGFSDNAAGVAMLLAIAKAMGEPAAPRMRSSVLYLFFTGEERGLLGSDYLVARPPWPLERIKGVINLDGGAPPAAPSSWRIAGGAESPLGQLAVEVALWSGWSATVSKATPNSDYYPFIRHGVPSIFIIPGSGPYDGLSRDSSQALRRKWDRYHQPGDEWSPEFPFAGLRRYAKYAHRVGTALDHGVDRPRRARDRP